MVRAMPRARAQEGASSPISEHHGQTSEDAIDLDSDIEEIEEEVNVEKDGEEGDNESEDGADKIAAAEVEDVNGDLDEQEGESSSEIEEIVEEEREEPRERRETEEAREGEDDHKGEKSGHESLDSDEERDHSNYQDAKTEMEGEVEVEVESEESESELEHSPVTHIRKPKPKAKKPAKQKEDSYDTAEETIRGEIAAGLEEQANIADDSDVASVAEDSDDSADDVAILLVQPFTDKKKFLRKKRKRDGPNYAKKVRLNTPEDQKTAEDYEPTPSDSESENTEEFVEAISPQEDLLPYDLTDHTSAENLPHFPDVIEIESEGEEAVAPKSDSVTSASAIRLLYNSSYDLSDLDEKKDVNLDTVTVEELVGQKDLVETYQFNFNVDIEYFLSFLHPEFSKKRRKVTFITGNTLLTGHPLESELRKKFDISDVVASLPNRFASHHSKMMVNFFEDDEAEVVISTSNLTQLDFMGLTQAIWRSGRLQKGNTSTTSGKRFRIDLIRYLTKYKLNTTDILLKKLEGFDFSSVDVELIASAPGVYSMEEPKSKEEAYGFLKLRQVLKRNDLLLDHEEAKHNILAQVTSIAYPYLTRRGKTSSMFTHLLCPLMFKEWDQLLEPGAQASREHQREFRYKPHIVFPTAKEIAGSNFGFLSGSANHFKYTPSTIYRQQYEQNIKPYLRKWGHGSQTGREKVTPHVKYYTCDNGDDWKSLKWVMVGSHNLSKQAWGYPLAKSDGTQFEVGSYELSVFKAGKEPLIPVYGSDVLPAKSTGVPVRFPFVVPPTPYLAKDQAWSADIDFGQLHDRWGNTHHGSFS